MLPVSVVITTFNNAPTIRPVMESAAWADEIVVVDSGSTDGTLEIVAEFTDRIIHQPFLGFSKQKQLSIDSASHDWCILLDADEVLSDALTLEIRDVLSGKPQHAAYNLPRIEQLFWRMNHNGTRLNHFLRLFDRRTGAMNGKAVHESFATTGSIGQLKGGLYHFSGVTVDVQVEKINQYSTLSVKEKIRHRSSVSPWILVFYPPLYFFKSFVMKRNFLNGWAGFIGAVCMSFNAFLKYAKLYAHFQTGETGALIESVLAADRKQSQAPHSQTDADSRADSLTTVPSSPECREAA